MSNLESEAFSLSEGLCRVLDAMSMLSREEIETLAHLIDPNGDFEQSASSDFAPVRNSVFGEVASEYRKKNPPDPKLVLAYDGPDFDDPDWLAKLHTDAAPLSDRKRLFVRIWQSFADADRMAFINRIDPKGVFREVLV